MLVGLQQMQHEDKVYVIYKIDHLITDENLKNKIPITSHDATKHYPENVDIEMNDDHEIISIDVAKYTMSKIAKNFKTLSDMINHENTVYMV